ncbi:MAG TPA: transglycosylase family protein [Candidatus Limnocylindrales bacterium]|nr:transglycosylase family protein [Candidatus Limnocylindrales bacterium]
MKIRLSLVVLLFAVVFFAIGNKSAHAETQNPQTPEKPTIVKVQPGDYLAKIAAEHNTTYPRLYDANEIIKDPDVIYPGSDLRIPRPDEQLPSRAPASAAPIPAPVSAPAATGTASPPPQRAVQSQATSIKQYGGTVWDQLAQCESGGNWSINTGNGFYGGLQFTLASWRGVGGSGYPHQASREEQIARAEILLSKQGWGAWPACSAKLGLR